MAATRVAVIGGGITGLVAARDLARAGAEVTVFEPGPLGGKIRTGSFAGRPVELGPDAFLTRAPEALDLCAELGLTGDLVVPAARTAAVWWDRRLVPMPPGLVLGVPARLGGLARSGLLSPAGMARAALDLVLPPTSRPSDCSVRDLVASRFGAQVADRLVDPLIGGIHAGVTAELSAAATTPQLLAAAREGRSLLRALAAGALATGAPSPDGPVFSTPRGGLGVLVDRLVAGLTASGVTIESRAVHDIGVGGRTVSVDDAERAFDGAVMAVPAATAARLLGVVAPDGLTAIPTASVTMVLLSYGEEDLPTPPGLSGFLVPRAAGRLMTACSFASAKWPHWAEPGTTLLRVSAGRHGDLRHLRLEDDQLLERIVDEVSEALGRSCAPRHARVIRWPDAFPQYLVGHLDVVGHLEADLRRRHPRVVLAGASYRGSGLPACIRSAHRAAAGLSETLRPTRNSAELPGRPGVPGVPEAPGLPGAPWRT